MTRSIILASGHKTIVDDDDFELLSSYRWCLVSGKHGLCYVGGHKRIMHRMIMNPPENMLVDHINGDPLDNRKQNLRICTKAQNGHNVRSVCGAVQFKGVWFNKKLQKYAAGIRLNKRSKHIGVFTLARDAAIAYDAAATEHFGEFAATNASLGLL